MVNLQPEIQEQGILIPDNPLGKQTAARNY